MGRARTPEPVNPAPVVSEMFEAVNVQSYIVRCRSPLAIFDFNCKASSKEEAEQMAIDAIRRSIKTEAVSHG